DDVAGSGDVKTTGTPAAVVLGKSVSLVTDAGRSGTGGAVNFSSSTLNALAANTGSLAIQAGNGAITFGQVGATTALGGLTATPTGRATLNGNVFTDKRTGAPGTIFFFVPTVVLGADVTIDSDANNDGASGQVNMNGLSITPTAAGQQGLTVVSGDGGGGL